MYAVAGGSTECSLDLRDIAASHVERVSFRFGLLSPQSLTMAAGAKDALELPPIILGGGVFVSMHVG